MKFSDADRRTYPRLYRYIRYSIPQVATVGVITRNLRTYGSLSAEQSRTALAWNNDPMVVITPLGGGQCGVPAANGCFRPANPNQIEIDEGRALEFERGDAAAVEQTSSGRNVYVVGTTLLHELCHWGRHLNGTPYEHGEEGVDFEVATYGRNVG